MMNIAKSETFWKFTILNKALLFLIKYTVVFSSDILYLCQKCDVTNFSEKIFDVKPIRFSQIFRVFLLKS